MKIDVRARQTTLVGRLVIFEVFVSRNLFTIMQFSIVVCYGKIKVRLKCKRKFKSDLDMRKLKFLTLSAWIPF